MTLKMMGRQKVQTEAKNVVESLEEATKDLEVVLGEILEETREVITVGLVVPHVVPLVVLLGAHSTLAQTK